MLLVVYVGIMMINSVRFIPNHEGIHTVPSVDFASLRQKYNVDVIEIVSNSGRNAVC